MPFEVFAAQGAFRKGNIHTHSDRSDGVLSPEAVCETYRNAGYDFLCLSDHFLARYAWPVVDTAPFRRDGFATLLGAEVHAPANSHGEAWHILACGLPPDFAPTAADETGVALARRAREAGAFVGIAHPQWSSLAIEDGRALADIAHAVEIYNTGCERECARGDGTTLLDALLNEGHLGLTAYAADDAHFRIDDAFGGWMMVRSPENEAAALLAAMKAGMFYSSQGPEIRDVRVEGDSVVVECSPAANVAVLGRGSRAENRRGDDLTRVALPLERFAGDWGRVVVTDANGRHAWSNPARL